jgi:prevent-host-death family protein
MIKVGVAEARSNWSTLLDRVERGETLIITRRGVPVARLVPDASGIDTSLVQNALQRMRARALEIKPGTFDWAALKRDRDSGRP